MLRRLVGFNMKEKFVLLLALTMLINTVKQSYCIRKVQDKTILFSTESCIKKFILKYRQTLASVNNLMYNILHVY